VALLAACATLAASVPADAKKAGGSWKTAATRLRTAELAEARADYWLALARAAALADAAERRAAEADAKAEFKDDTETARDRYGARLDLAETLGESAPPVVAVNPAHFVATIDNPYLPYTVGKTWTYRAETGHGTETIVVTVLPEKKEILGVSCTVVRDTVSVGGELVEDTHDWFAQDVDGNVWYFGEISLNYDDGELSGVDGSWQAGVDGAQPGIVMRAAPAVGDVYRQEFYLGEAEDYGEVLALGETVTVPFGTFANCLRTFDGSPMEPDAAEHKSYAPGVGLVLEFDVEDGERVELISVTTN
jgi:hypothetical protein